MVTRAAMYTGALVSGLTLAAMTAPSEKYLQMSGPLMMGFAAVFAASVATAFLPPTGRCLEYLLINININTGKPLHGPTLNL